MGDELPVQSFRVTRADLVRYAGASGDFNPIHWSERVATGVGLPGVIAHGMYTMALGARALAEWFGDPSAILDYSVRFTKPVPVPDDDAGAEVVFTGSVRDGDVPGTLRVDLAAVCAGQKVLGQARAVVRGIR